MTGTGEAVVFWVLSCIAVPGALALLFARKAVHAAIGMVTTMIVLGVFYLLQEAHFLGVVHIFVYTGAVMMLFLFVLMLIGVDSSDSLVETLRGQRLAAAVIGLGFGILLIAGIGTASVATFAGAPAAGGSSTAGDGNVEAIAELIFVQYL